MMHSPAAAALTDLILEVFRVNGDLLREGDRLTRPDGQTSSRWQVLGAIADAPHSVAGIARDMGLTRQSVQRTADLLEREGLVEYVDNPSHRRAKLVRPTSKGTEVLAGISKRQVEWANSLGSMINANERRIRDALDVLRQLRVELEERPAEPEFRARRASSTGRETL